MSENFGNGLFDTTQKLMYMKRSQISRNTIDRSESTIAIRFMLVCLGLFVSSFVFSQASIERTLQCSCIDNGAPEGLAQFEEEIQVSSMAGETWYIDLVSGFYQLGSPVPPAAQLDFATGPGGDLLIESAPGVYTLSGLMVENIGYSIRVTNGMDTLALSNILCAFPSADIVGDNAVCGAEELTYSASTIDATYTYNWDVSGGVITSAANETDVTVLWDDLPGETGLLELTVTGATGCSSMSFMVVEFEEDINLVSNNLVHISTNDACGVSLGVDDVLENMQYNEDSYTITITDPSTGDVVDLDDAISDYLFDTLEFSVTHVCSDNSTWGNLIIEDKQVLPLLCVNDTIRCDANDAVTVIGFPLPTSAVVVPLGDDVFRVENFDPCGDGEITFQDEDILMTCAEDFESRVERTFLFTDFSGSTSTCTQIIYKERTTLDDVVFPGNWDGVDNPTLQCDGNWPTLPNGFPDPSFTGLPEEGVCSHISITYTDLPTDVCGGTYKVVRKITAHDHCTGETRTENQIIKIEDNDAPIFTEPSDLTLSISNASCVATVSTPLPTNIIDCSEVSFEAEIVLLNSVGNIDGPIAQMTLNGSNFIAIDRALGTHRITYFATDACGFESNRSFLVTIIDQTAPTAVCDQNTTIAIDTEGYAIVPVSTFDDGSYDNCEIASIEISRGPNACGASAGFGETITLCCEDVNTEVMVTLKVTDASGNVNTCMVMVMVQDKKPPILTCPANVTINCNDDFSDLSIFGTPTVEDNCSATVSETSNVSINGCSVGSITRTFKAIDTGGNEVICSQIITVEDPDPLTLNNIIWPANYNTNNCVTTALHPDDLPFNNAYPQVANNQCSDIHIDFSDKIFIGVNSIACKTIIRTWTVKDLCGDPDGFMFDQSLQILDNQDPQFDECSNKIVEGAFAGDCMYAVELSKTATDQCTPQDMLAFSYTVDFNSDGIVNLSGSSSTINENFPVGQHKVEWIVSDECGNETSCVEFITIQDKKQPTPYCLGGISTVLMPSNGTVAIWAEDFDVSSEDDCTAQEDLEFSFSADPSNTGRIFTCADLDGAEEQIIELQVYVHDEAGNYDFCTSYIRLQDNNNTCDTSMVQMSLSGLVFTEDQEKMKDVGMELTNLIEGNTTEVFTDENGVYAFHDLNELLNYEVTPFYDDNDVHNGISTFDILLIQKHILGLTPLNSPYKVIAADVDENESINGIDIIQIRKLLLGYYDEFPASDSWKFVDAHQEFMNQQAPWPYNNYTSVLTDQSYNDMNFVMIKTGDVNLSRSTDFASEESTVRNTPENIEYQWIVKDHQHVLVLSTTQELNINGFQVELEVESPVIGVNSPLSIDDESVYTQDDVVRISWSGASAQRVSGTLLEVTFGAPTPIKIVEKGRFESEIYLEGNGGIEVRKMELTPVEMTTETYQTKVYQNKPNPFMEQTEIVVELVESETVQLEIYDMNGRVVLQDRYALSKGKNSITLTSDEIDSAGKGGVFIYTISGSFGQLSNRMIIIQ